MVPLASMYLPGTCEKTSFGVKESAVIVSPYVYILTPPFLQYCRRFIVKC